MSACTDACDRAYDPICANTCRAMRSRVRRAICWAGCAEEYAACLAACAAEAVGEAVEDGARKVADALSRAAQWLKDHPEVVVGTLIVVGVVTFVVVTGGSGAVLVPVAVAA
jgi:hypothetical protein